MAEGGELSDASSDETIVEGFVVGSDLEEKEFRAKRFSDKDMVSPRKNNITAEITNICGEELSPEIHFICINLHTQKETEPINLSDQDLYEMEDSQSLIPAGINNAVIATSICQCDCLPNVTLHEEYEHDSQVDGVLQMSDRTIINKDDSLQISLLSDIDAEKSFPNDMVPKYKEMSVVFQSIGKSSGENDTAKNDPSHEAVASVETINSIMAEMFGVQNLMEPLGKTVQIYDISDYQNSTFSIDTSVNEESKALPEKLLTALNSLTESVEAPVVYKSVENKNGHSIAEKQIDADLYMHPLHHSDPQKTAYHETPVKKGNFIFKDMGSCEQLSQKTSYTLRKSAVNDVDATNNCQQFLEGMHQKTHRFNGKDKDNSLQPGICKYHCSHSDVNTKIEQVRKSQRIAKKTRKQNILKHSSNDSPYNYTSLSTINRRDAFGQTLLHRAAMENDLEGVCSMIKAGANVNAQDYAGWTPLHESSMAGYFETTNELLKAGANVNCKGYEQEIPLHDAVKEGHYKVAELLLWYGADPLFKNEKGKNALEQTTDKQMKKLVESYMAQTGKRSASDSSQSKKKSKVTSQLQGTTIAVQGTTTTRANKRNVKGETQLHLASKKGKLSLVKSLIASGACVNQKNNAGCTVIHEASKRGFTEIIAELLEAGADVNSKNLDGVLPLHDAVSGNHFEAIQLLLRHGANPNEGDNSGKNALDKATCDQIKELLKSYAATEVKETALMSHDVGERKLSRSRCRKKPYKCQKKEKLVPQPNLAGQKHSTHGSINKALQDIEDKQNRLLLFELKCQRDADLYIQDLSQIQSTLNTILARQKSERDELAKKYRASVESFKQGTLRQQLVKLATRQKNLLLMAQTQKELGKKIQNYKNAKKEASNLAKQVQNSLDSYESNNTNDGASDKTVPFPNIMSLENSWNIKISSLNQEYPNMFSDTSGGNREIISKKEDPQHLVFENNVKEFSIAERRHSKSDATESTLLSNSVTCFTQEPQETNHILGAAQENNITNTSSRLNVLNNSAAGSIDANNININNNISKPTTENQHISTNESFPQHSGINNAFSIQSDVELESTHSCIGIHQENIASNKKVTLNVNLEHRGTFSHAVSQSRTSQNSSECSNSQDSEKQLRFKANKKKKYQLLDLLALGKIKSGENVLEFILQDFKHKASLLENGRVQTDNNSVYQNPVQWIKAILGNDISVSWKYVYNKVTYCGMPLSTIIAEIQDPKEPGLPLQQKVLFESLHQAISSNISRFLQFNKVMLIMDEEFMPCHAGDDYWNFYVHCENFGF